MASGKENTMMEYELTDRDGNDRKERRGEKDSKDNERKRNERKKDERKIYDRNGDERKINERKEDERKINKKKKDEQEEESDPEEESEHEEESEREEETEREERSERKKDDNKEKEVSDVYVRYYCGHKGKFGHEFLEFEFRPNGKLRYANNSNYKNDTMIRKEVYVGKLVMKELQRIVEDSDIMEEDDSLWPKPSVVGRQELEIVIGDEHISLMTAKINSLIEVNDSRDPEGLKTLYYVVQDLKNLVYSLIGMHFKIRPI